MKANLLNLGMGILMAAMTSACAPGFAPMDANDEGGTSFASSSDLTTLLKNDYQQVKNEGVASQTVEPGAPIDATGLTDDQVVQAIKDRLLTNLDKMQKAIANAKAAGKDVSRTEDIYAQAELHTEEFLSRLENDADFRARIIASIRKQKPPQGAVPKAPQPVELDDKHCALIKNILTTNHGPQAALDSLRDTYNKKCQGK